MAKQRKNLISPPKSVLFVVYLLHGAKKWSKCWDDVKYCSEKCRRQK